MVVPAILPVAFLSLALRGSPRTSNCTLTDTFPWVRTSRVSVTGFVLLRLMRRHTSSLSGGFRSVFFGGRVNKECDDDG